MGKSDEVRGLDCWKIRNQDEKNKLFSTVRALTQVPGPRVHHDKPNKGGLALRRRRAPWLLQTTRVLRITGKLLEMFFHFCLLYKKLVKWCF